MSIPTCFSKRSALVDTHSWPLCWLLVHNQQMNILHWRQKNSCRYLCVVQIFSARLLVGGMSSCCFRAFLVWWGFRWASQYELMHTRQLLTASRCSPLHMSQATAEDGNFPLDLDEEVADPRALRIDSRASALRAPLRSCSTASASMVFLDKEGLGQKVWRHWGQL